MLNQGKCYSLSKLCDVLHMCMLSVRLFLSFVCDFRAALFGLFRSWLGEVLGVELEPIVDVSCAKYQYTGQSHVFTSTLQKDNEQSLNICMVLLERSRSTELSPKDILFYSLHS